MKENIIEKVVKEISENHHKIIDDWCKAYMAQLYQEGYEVKPGCFTLYEQEPTMQDGIFAKRYWFKYGTPDYPEYTNWVKCSDLMPEQEERVLAWDGEKIEIAYRDKILMFESNRIVWTCAEYIELPDVTHWMPLPSKPKDNKGQDYDY